MTRFVVDASAVLQISSEGLDDFGSHKLLAPTLLRSQVLSLLHEAVHKRTLEPDVAVSRLAHIQKMPIRLLGDAVLQRRAWRIADELRWAKTYEAEYIALTQLQADAFITMDLELASKVAGLVAVATIDMLRL